VLRVSDPQRRWPHAVQDLLTVLHGQEDLSRYKQLPAWTEEDTKHYHERLEEIGNWAESLREEMDTPKTRAPSSDA